MGQFQLFLCHGSFVNTYIFELAYCMSASKRPAEDKSSPPRMGRLPRLPRSIGRMPSLPTLLPRVSEAGSTPSLPTLLPRPSEVGNPRHEYVPLPPRRRVSRPVARNIVHQPPPPINAKQILIDDFNQRKDAASTFPPKLTASTTRAVVKQFQSHLVEVASNVEYVCTSCGLFIPVVKVT